MCIRDSAQAYSGEETELEFQEVDTATKRAQTDIEEEAKLTIERGETRQREKTTEADISGWATRDTGDVTPVEEVSQKADEATDTQILRKPGDFKAGTVNDAKARQQIAAKLVELKSEARKLKGEATRAETSLSKAQNQLSKARGKKRIAELTKEVRRLKSAATKKRNRANKADEAVQDIVGFKTLSGVKLQRAYNELGIDLPGTAKLETLEQQEKAKKERIARAETILEGIDDVSINQAAALESAWNDNKTDDAPTFSKLTIHQRLEWGDRVLLAIHDKAPKDIPNQQKLMEETLDEYIGEPTAQSKEVAARREQADKQTRDRKLKLSRERDTKKISTKAAAEKYGTAKLKPIYGTFWRSHKDNSILKTHLRNKDWIKYQSVVDKRVATFKAMTKKEQREWRALNVRQKGKKSKGFADSFLEPPNLDNWGILKSDNPKKKENLENFFRRLLGEKEYRRIRKRVYYFNDAREARRVIKEEFGEAQAEVGTEVAFVTKWNIKGQPDIITFILNRVHEGYEESTFVHEVAGHIGFDNLLTKQERSALEGQVFGWSLKDRLKYEGEPFYALNVKDMLDQGWKVDTPGYMLNENGERIQIADSIEHLAAREAVRRARGKGCLLYTSDAADE